MLAMQTQSTREPRHAGAMRPPDDLVRVVRDLIAQAGLRGASRILHIGAPTTVKLRDGAPVSRAIVFYAYANLQVHELEERLGVA
jgi:hypothetical protein